MFDYQYEQEYEDYIAHRPDELREQPLPETEKITHLAVDFTVDTLIPPESSSKVICEAMRFIRMVAEPEDLAAFAAIFAAAIDLGYSLGRKNALAYLYFTQEPAPEEKS